MRVSVWTGVLAAAAIILGTASVIEAADVFPDPYLWLEDIHGSKALDWVQGQNAKSLGLIENNPNYRQDYETILSLLDADDRIPIGQVHGDYVFDFWQDARHVRGIWRRTSIASYETASPQWETLLDVDRLAAGEGKNWVFKGASCSPDLSRCLIRLSPDGGDTVVLREFDPAAKRFIDGGFALGQAKAEAAYVDADTIMFSTDFGPGTLTKAGYPRIVKLWHRGEPLADAKVLFEGQPDDVVVSPLVFQAPGGSTALVSRGVSFFETEYFYARPDGTTIRLPLPLSADVHGVLTAGSGGTDSDWLIATVRKDWKPEGQPAIKQGSLIAFSLKSFLSSRVLPRVSVLYVPGPRASLDDVAVGRDAIYASIYQDVAGSIHRFEPAGDGSWTDTQLDLPKGGSTEIASVNAFGPDVYFTFQGFLTPTTLYSGHQGRLAAIKSLPARFDAAPYAVRQYEATSKDGTKIPYFVVRAKDATGPMPMLLTGYGGFEISQTPFYWSSMGRLWLPKGGAYAVANIRGGGEFGPAWHEAALKTNRQRSFDDFIAVAEDMIRRGITTSKQLGIMGGSNGGLLAATVAVERPDLFGAVVSEVPLLDMLRFPKFGAGASWIAEYGDPENPEDRAALLRYSPYQNVKPGVTYPSMFFITATSDDRVTPVHARKMAAKMEAQGHDVLFYENTEGGHAAAANHAEQAQTNALALAYLEQKLGLD